MQRAYEDLALQGLFFPPEKLALFRNSFLSDLAGNAFESSSCTAAMLAGLLLLAECHHRRQSIDGQCMTRCITPPASEDLDDAASDASAFDSAALDAVFGALA